MKHSEIVQLADRTLTLETGGLAGQAAGAVVVRQGASFVLATVVAGPGSGERGRNADGGEFLPLTVEYQERHAAVGRIPSMQNRREGRITDGQILTCRTIDRTLRPLFDPRYGSETLVQVTVFGVDPESDLESLGLLAAATAVHLSDLPFGGPVAGLRIVQLPDRTLRILPTPAERQQATLDLMVACTPQGLVMLEGFAADLPEERVAQAVAEAQEQARPLLAAITRLGQAAGAPRRTLAAPRPVEPWYEQVVELSGPDIRAALTLANKIARRQALLAAEQAMVELLGDTAAPELLRRTFWQVLRAELRQAVLDGRRIAGRGLTELRPIQGEVGLLASNHGSALFTRGQTQALVSVTLGTESEALVHDGLFGRESEKFLLQYSFPGYAVGEVRPSRWAPGRREIGHGVLARRALVPVLPPAREFPYTIRVVADITESDGSSSMATVCGGTLALYDAGVPLRAPVAGVAVGLVVEGERQALLTDICGYEDHFGDLDLKVAGTRDGVTALQLDLKLGSLPAELFVRGLAAARQARGELLDRMAELLPAPRERVNPRAPQILRLRVNPARIGSLIGLGGKRIKELQSSTQTTINVEQDGRICLVGKTLADVERARARIEQLCSDLVLDGLYLATVTSLQDYGLFVKIGDHGSLVHVSELAGGDEALTRHTPGDRLLVRVIGVDGRGRLRLSQLAAETGNPADALNAEWSEE